MAFIPSETTVRNPVYTEGGHINCEVQLRPDLWAPYTASASDVEAVGRLVYDIALAMGPAPYVAPPPPEPEPLTDADVNAERDRRILLGDTFALTGGPSVPISGDPVTIRNLTNLALAAQLQIAAGNGAAVTQFRDDANTIHSLTQPQVLELWQYGAAFVEAHFQAAWLIKDAEGGIPADYADDSRWP